MNHKNILVLALRVAAIIMCMHVIETFPAKYIDYMLLEEQYSSKFLLVMGVVAPGIISASFAVLFWVYPKKIIRWIVPDAEIDGVETEYFESLNASFISVIGIYILAYAIADLFYYYSLSKEMLRQFGSEFSLPPNERAAYYSTIAQCVIGLVLVVGNKMLSRGFRKLSRQ